MMEKKKKRFWLSYDLGLQGDYSSLYVWLDSMKARECGDNIATFTFEYELDCLGELKASLEKAVNFNKDDRIYVVWKAIGGGSEEKTRGKFLFGNRKLAPWTGFSRGIDDIVDEDE
jgi:hypothetical protein